MRKRKPEVGELLPRGGGFPDSLPASFRVQKEYSKVEGLPCGESKWLVSRQFRQVARQHKENRS